MKNNTTIAAKPASLAKKQTATARTGSAKPASKDITPLTSAIKIPREIANRIRAACDRGNWSVHFVCAHILEGAAEDIAEMVRPLSIPAKKVRRPMNTPELLASLWQEMTPLKPNPVAGMEAMAVVYLDHDGCLIDWTLLGVGILGVTFDPQVIVAEGKHLKAAAFALIHNHPPGYSIKPSKEDLEHVRLLDSEVSTESFRFHDSVIVNGTGWHSIKEDRWARWRRPEVIMLREADPERQYFQAAAPRAPKGGRAQ